MTQPEILEKDANPEKLWWFHDGQKEWGPFSQAILMSLLATKEITLESLVYCEGMDDWQQIKTLAQFTIPSETQSPQRISKSPKRTWFLVGCGIIVIILTLGAAFLGKLHIKESAYYASDIDFTLSTNGPTISIDKYFGIGGNVTIPDTFHGKKVTTIGDAAFASCFNLTSVTIPNGVISLVGSAFRNCEHLKSLTIPDSVTSIGNSAFDGCTALTSVTIPNSVTNIGNSAFDGCTALTSVTIPNSVTNIGSRAFFKCQSLKSITIGNRVIHIGESAFQNCDNLKSLTIPDSVTSIGDSAFNGCTELTSVTIGKGVTNILGDLFYYCTSLRNVTDRRKQRSQ